MTLEGKVTNILNDRELAINLGSERAVVEGDVFEVIGEPQQVCDPDTKEPLGEVDPSRIKVRVFEVHGKFAVARTFETYVAEIDEPSYPFLINVFPPPRPTRRIRRVKKLLQPQIVSGYPRFTEEGAYIKEGDKVRQIHYVQEE